MHHAIIVDLIGIFQIMSKAIYKHWVHTLVLVADLISFP